MSVNINKDTMVKVRTDVTHKCVGNENSKTNLFELQQQKALKIVYLENQQRQCFNLSCGNGGGVGREPNVTEIRQKKVMRNLSADQTEEMLLVTPTWQSQMS